MLRTSTCLFAGLPLILLGVVRVGLVVLALAGRPPFWAHEPLTLSEAAALRDGGEVARLIEAGEDPNATYRVRRGIVRGRVEVTPMEAATAARRPEIIRLLLDAGARAD